MWFRFGKRDQVSAPIHRLRFHKVVQGTGASAEDNFLQLPRGHIRIGMHHGRTVHTDPTVPRGQWSGPDEQDRAGAGHTWQKWLALGVQNECGQK